MHSPNIGNRTDSPNTLALVLAGGNGARLFGLTSRRAKPAVPFGGHHRIIDYVLSNCVNSSIQHVALLTQYKAQSLIRHMHRNWLDGWQHPAAQIEIWPAQQRNGENWYTGTADAVYQNRDLIEELDPDNVLVLAGDHVYAMDYRSMIAAHSRASADVTISCVDVPVSQSHHFGIVSCDPQSRLTSFTEKPTHLADSLDPSSSTLASMGVYLFKTKYLLARLDADARDGSSRHDFGYDILPRLVGETNVHVHRFRGRGGGPGYWRDVGTVDSYWLAHRDLLQQRFNSDSDRRAWPLCGGPRASVPARLNSGAAVTESVLGAASVIEGAVNQSIISSNCRVGRGSVVSESVLLPGATVGRNCVLGRVILDSRCHLPDETVLEADNTMSGDGIHVSPAGVVLVTEHVYDYRSLRPDRCISA